MDQLTLVEKFSRRAKKARAVVAAVRLIRDPNKLGEVFEIADDLASPEMLDLMISELSLDPSAKRALEEKPRLGKVDLKELAALPEGTLGHAFARHMLKNGLDPAALPNLESTDARSFLRAHLYETHDIWHVVAGFDTDVAGELGLQAFYAAQLPTHLAPALLGGGFFNTLLFAWPDRDRRMNAIVRGWLLGRRAKSFFGVPWANLWATPLDDVRRAFSIDIPRVEHDLAA